VFTVKGQISVLTSIEIHDVLCFVINVVELSLKLYIWFNRCQIRLYSAAPI